MKANEVCHPTVIIAFQVLELCLVGGCSLNFRFNAGAVIDGSSC
jgi:hypothetical protein